MHTCDVTHFISVAWLIHKCDMTHSYVWHDSFIRVTWLFHMHDMTFPYVWHDSSMSVTWLIHTCSTMIQMKQLAICWVHTRKKTRILHMRAMTLPYMWHDSSIRSRWSARQLSGTTKEQHEFSCTWLIHIVVSLRTCSYTPPPTHVHDHVCIRICTLCARYSNTRVCSSIQSTSTK